jgi:hypothetical protein
MKLVCILAAAIACYGQIPAAAHAAPPSVALHVTLSPERLGHDTTLRFALTVSYPPGQAPVPLREIALSYPNDLGIETSGLGTATCQIATLQKAGPAECPTDSLMGYGSALVEVPFGSQDVYERAKITILMAPLAADGNLALLIYVAASTPVFDELTLPSIIAPAPAPFGGQVDVQVPAIESLPEGPDGALVELTTTLGPSSVVYDEYTHGRRIPYHPRGIRLPRKCPHGGFPFASQLVFSEGPPVYTQAAVPCPRRRPGGHH